jgi:hypothetical protein
LLWLPLGWWRLRVAQERGRGGGETLEPVSVLGACSDADTAELYYGEMCCQLVAPLPYEVYNRFRYAGPGSRSLSAA